jgi:hypothetical protein
MDAKEFFSAVVVENYKEAIADPANLRKLWNAAVSMNTIAEYLAGAKAFNDFWLAKTTTYEWVIYRRPVPLSSRQYGRRVHQP